MIVARGLWSTDVDTGHDISTLTRWLILVIIWDNKLIECNHIVNVRHWTYLRSKVSMLQSSWTSVITGYVWNGQFEKYKREKKLISMIRIMISCVKLVDQEKYKEVQQKGLGEHYLAVTYLD